MTFNFTKYGDYTFQTEDGYYLKMYDSSDYFIFQNDTYPVERFDLKYNRPDIVLDRLGYADPSTIKMYHNAYLKRLKEMGVQESTLENDEDLLNINLDNFKPLHLFVESEQKVILLYNHHSMEGSLFVFYV